MSGAPKLKPAPLPGLTGLRGVGALWVVAYHLQFGLNIPLADAGYLGVDLFFILSGFVLSHAHPERRWTWARYGTFLRTRVARIFPMHWFALALLLVALFALPEIRAIAPDRYRWPGFVASAGLVQNWGLSPPGVWNAPAWSLSTEWAVSLLFPMFLWLARRIEAARSAVLLTGLCIVAFAVFLLATRNIGPGVIGRAGLIRTMCEFAAGCFLYRAYAAGVVPGATGTGTGIVLIAVGLLSPSLGVVAVFGFPIIVLQVAQNASYLARMLSGRIMLFLGEISYSVYLLHFILLLVLQRLQDGLGIHGARKLPWVLLYLVVVLLLSTATYHLVERPARRWMRGLGGKAATSPVPAH